MVRRIAAAAAAASLAALTLGACAGDDVADEESFATQHPVAEGSKEALALVAFLNDAGTGDAQLKAAGIKTSAPRAATLAHRSGADGVAGTNDDDAFDDVAEFDAVKGIGPATISAVAGYAIANGYGPTNGLYLGVYFTEKQVTRTLELVNSASLGELDVDAFLDKRAAENIVAARPIAGMSQLTAVSRVKASALRLLRDHADRTLGPETCGAGDPCPSGLFCTGGSTSPGRCVDTSVEGSGDPCSASGACGDGLVCAGRDDDFVGICNPEWMKDEFVNEGAASIPDGPNGSSGMSVDVVGLATVPTDAVVHARIEHARQADLELTLENPTGTSVLVWPAGSGPVPATIPVNVPGDESVNGLWTLTVKDKSAGVTGAITLFTLELTSRFD